MSNELYGKDRPMLMERLGRLSGSTTYRGPDSGGGTPFAARGMTTEAELLLALKMAQQHPRDVGPWIAYSIATRLDDRQGAIVTWLADKLIAGTGAIGKRNASRMLTVALAAYQLAIHGTEPKRPGVRPVDFEGLVNIGAGWLWVKCEGAVDLAERALHSRAEPFARILEKTA